LIIEEIGTIQALLDSIKTLRDGSCKITFEVNPDNVDVLNRLMQKFLINQKLFTIAIVQTDGNDEPIETNNQAVAVV
jgi:flagellar biosynthesis/type III secretory pathway protein FliH